MWYTAPLLARSTQSGGLWSKLIRTATERLHQGQVEHHLRRRALVAAMITKSGVIHAIFECCDCAKTWENYLTAQELALRHAKAKRHMVKGDIGKYVSYDGRVEEPEL